MTLHNLDIEKKSLDQYKVILEDWIPEDASIAIAVKNTFVYFGSGYHKISLKVGSPVPPDSVAYKVLQTNRKVDAVMDSSLFDTPYYAIGYPILLDGVRGALIIVLPPHFKINSPDTYRFLTGKQNEEWSPVPIEQISHIESLQKKTWFYKEGKQYKTSVTLKELQLRLPDIFIRIHRSYIINIYFIQTIYRDITSNFIVKMKDGTELPISQSYVNEIRKVLEF
jgi:two-component system, LytTR family, response regulator